MSLARSSIIKGPGSVKLGSAFFYPKETVNVELVQRSFEINNIIHGPVDRRRDDRVVEVGFVPVGEVENLTTLYPHQNPDIGASIYGSSDTACEVHSKAGVKVTLHSAAIVRMPPLILSAAKTVFGSALIRAITKNNADPEDAASLYTIASSAWSDTSLATSAIKTQPFSAAWGAILASIITEAGWTVTPEMRTKTQQIDEDGTVDEYLESVSIMAKCRPVNLTEANIWDAMKVQNDAAAARGSSMRSGSDLVIQSAGLTVTIKDAQLVEGPLRYGTTELRAGEIGFVGHRSESTGTFGNLFALA